MRLIFWLLFGLGSALLIFAVLLSQVPGEDRTFDKVVFSITGLLLAASFTVGRFRGPAAQWRPGPILTVLLSAELLLCLYGLVSVLTYRRC
jgi:hypothetical protein